MSNTNVDLTEYRKDSRIPCKYGAKCYQKNPAHHSKYKHPPQNNKRKHITKAGPSKKTKIEDHQQDHELSKLNSDEAIGECQSPKEEISDSDDMNETEVKHQQKKECISDSSSEPEDQKLEPPPEPEEVEAPETIFDPKEFIKTKFLVELPKDFYEFWDYCTSLNSNDPCGALKNVNLKLVGPFDVLSGKFKSAKCSPEDYLRHWRYFYDPPELLTVLKGSDSTGYHIGYFYDSPDQLPQLLVSNHGTKDGILTKMGDNIFAAVAAYLEEQQKISDPFKKMHIAKVLTSLKARAEKLKINLTLHSQQIRDREKLVVAKTSNKVGLVVPYNKKTQLGYRDLALGDKELMVLLSKLHKASPEQKVRYLSELQPVLTYANIALDECDFGTGVKLGWELLYHGIDSMDSTILQFFSNSYMLLKKEAFVKIAEAHLNNRKKGCDLSSI